MKKKIMICYYIFNKLVLILIYNKNKKFKEFKDKTCINFALLTKRIYNLIEELDI